MKFWACMGVLARVLVMVSLVPSLAPVAGQDDSAPPADKEDGWKVEGFRLGAALPQGDIEKADTSLLFGGFSRWARTPGRAYECAFDFVSFNDVEKELQGRSNRWETWEGDSLTVRFSVLLGRERGDRFTYGTIGVGFSYDSVTVRDYKGLPPDEVVDTHSYLTLGGGYQVKLTEHLSLTMDLLYSFPLTRPKFDRIEEVDWKSLTMVAGLAWRY